ncbi:virulence factor family protein [Sphingosinicella microcystinivorans]|uniref:Type IV secretory pathway VirJ component n=1 Tax=Sphingosinicella microcystinivorans TaxID=335406 RepID=A0AAD1D6L4_SPHMI|nr:AcvB/VirJ family lysyl-phosphatidylglycerol hydrolase [Sphingosinicella microcystinivorans]RKS91196.1 type IV secretory pathway VirJ component [Sphingosinicella microcystinivorans]BBE34164.1 virulence protein [Sphingosinicella microcystinivorans]
MPIKKTSLAFAAALALVGSGCTRPATDPVAATQMNLPPVGRVDTYRPVGALRGVALFMVPRDRITGAYRKTAVSLASEGFAIAVLPTEAIVSALPARVSCTNPNSVLARVVQSFEHALELNRYVRPALVGYRSGAALAYASFVQAPRGVYGSAISIDFNPETTGAKAWCAGKGQLTAVRTGDTASPRWRLMPASRLSGWTALDPEDSAVYAATARFVSAIPGARSASYTGGDRGIDDATPALVGLMAPMRAPMALDHVDRSRALGDLPLSSVFDPHAPRTDTMAVMYSGDGGWVGFDHQIAAYIASRGVPVVGVSTRDYFWTRKAAATASRDLERIIRHYGGQWGRKRVLLIGYSFGADTLPFMVNRLPQSLKAAISRISLLGLSKGADFEFHLSSWFNVERGDAVPTAPEVGRLGGLQVQCIRGADENGSACPDLAAPVTQAILPGGHHFDSNAGLVARTVLAGIKR